MIAQLKEFIKEQAGGDKVSLKESINADLLGGVVLRYGNKSLDLSLKDKLNKLKDSLIS